MNYLKRSAKKWNVLICKMCKSSRVRIVMLVCILLLSITNLMMLSPLTSSALAGATEQLEDITGQKIDRYKGKSGSGDSDREYRDPFSAPIFMMPAGCIGGVFMGGHWYFKKMSGDYPTTNFFDDYIKHQKIDNENAFNAGAFVGGIPWLALYAVTGPIRHGVVAISKAVNTSSSPKPRSNSEMASDYYNQGKIYETSGNLKLAEENYRSAIKYNPNLNGCHSQLANVLYRQGKYVDAIDFYVQSISLNSQNAGAYKKIADIYSHNLGQKRDAENWYRRALDIYPADDPNHPVVVRELINTVNDISKNTVDKALVEQKSLIKNGEYAKAESFWRKQLLVNPNNTDAWNKLGDTLVRQGRYLAAEAAYREAVRLDSSHNNQADNLKNLMESDGYGNALKELIADREQGIIATKELNMEAMRGRAMFCSDFNEDATKSIRCAYSTDHSAEISVFLPTPTPQKVEPNIPVAVRAKIEKDSEYIELREKKGKIEKEYKENLEALQAASSQRDQQPGEKPSFAAIDLVITEFKNKLTEEKEEYGVVEKKMEIITKKYVLDE